MNVNSMCVQVHEALLAHGGYNMQLKDVAKLIQSVGETIDSKIPTDELEFVEDVSIVPLY